MSIFSQPFRSCSNNPRKAFTLVELLTVVAIIGILASIVLTSLNATRVKSRDARRITDVDAIQASVEVYFRDNGHYPIAPSLVGFDPTSSIYSASVSAMLSPYYTVPQDPSGPSNGTPNGYVYISTANGSDYKILAFGTPENMSDFSPSSICTTGPSCPGGTNAIGYWSGGGALL